MNDAPQPVAPTADRVEWLRAARFGLFMHYGLYSLAGRHEHVMRLEHLTDEHYRRYFEHFTADRFDARAWARQARLAGMHYAVITTKHHDGFCLWDSEHTDFKSTNTPAGRDLVAEFVDAFRAEGLRVGLYHSIIDWHHPDYPVDGYHPQWQPGPDDAGRSRDGVKYAAYLRAQVIELAERFRPDMFWFDFAYPGSALVPDGKGAEFFQSAELVDEIRRIDPNILLNDRLDYPASADFVTPEEVAPGHLPADALWEACRTLNGSWGYAPAYQDWLDAGQTIRLLIDTVAGGGNLLLNVGPTGRGGLEPRAASLLDQIGGWLDLHADAIHGAGPSAVPAPRDCRITQNGNRVFLHLTGGWPTGHLALPDLPAPLRYAALVHDGWEVPHRIISDAVQVPHEVLPAAPGTTVLELPRRRPDIEVPVIELDLDW